MRNMSRSREGRGTADSSEVTAPPPKLPQESLMKLPKLPPPPDEPTLGHPLRGISVHCLMTTFLRECETAGFDLLAVPFPNVHDVASKVILAKGEDVVCPRDGMLGAAYVDCVRGADNAGTATHMLSYTWGYPVIVIAQALQCYCESHGLDPKRTYVWICFACVNEHRILGKDEADPVNSAELEGIFAEKVMCVDAVLSLMYPWYHPMVLDRAWCVYEMFVATSTDGEEGVLPRQRRRRLTGDPIEMTAAAAAAKAKMKTIMHPICKGQFSDALADDPKVFRDLWRRTQEVSAERAQASIQADLEMIKDRIERGPTFPVLNRKVRGELARACIETAVANCECLLKGVHVDNKMRRWWARLGFWTREEFLGALAIPELCIPIDDTEAKAFFDELDAKGPGAVAALQTELKAIDAAGNPSYKSCPPSELLRAGVTTCDLLKRNQQESDAIKLAQRIIDAFEECSETTTAERLLDGKEGARLKKLVKRTPQKSVSASSSPNSAMAGAHSPACTCSVV